MAHEVAKLAILIDAHNALPLTRDLLAGIAGYDSKYAYVRSRTSRK